MKEKNNIKPTIGFIGAGNMGLPMLRNLINKGFQVKVYDINPKITKKLEKDNIKTVNNLRGVASNQFIISILPVINYGINKKEFVINLEKLIYNELDRIT